MKSGILSVLDAISLKLCLFIYFFLFFFNIFSRMFVFMYWFMFKNSMNDQMTRAFSEDAKLISMKLNKYAINE